MLLETGIAQARLLFGDMVRVVLPRWHLPVQTPDHIMTLSPKYREEKATELAAIMLQRRGAAMSYLKLIKLLYLVERESLIRYGHPITYDTCYSLQHGPILSETLNLICEDPNPHAQSPWEDLISAPRGNREVRLLRDDFQVSSLSDADIELANEIFERFGHMSRWELRDYTHNLPEYQDPGKSRIPITYHEILIGARIAVEEARAIEDDLRAVAFSDLIL